MRRESISTQANRLSKDLEIRLKAEEQIWLDDIERYKECRDVVRDYVRRLNGLIDSIGFRDNLEEIAFFRRWFPKFQSKYFYYFKIWKIEGKIASMDKQKLKVYLGYRLKKLLRGKEENTIEYKELLEAKDEAAERYYLRINDTGDNPQLYTTIHSKSKCTNHSILLAKFMADDRIILYLKKKIKRLK